MHACLIFVPQRVLFSVEPKRDGVAPVLKRQEKEHRKNETTTLNTEFFFSASLHRVTAFIIIHFSPFARVRVRAWPPCVGTCV